MSNTGCAPCRLRVSHAEAAYLAGCPECGKPLHTFTSAAETIGFRLHHPQLANDPLPTAVSVALPPPRQPVRPR